MGETLASEERREGLIEQVETARVGAESWQDAAPSVAQKAPPPQRAAAAGDASDRMQVAGDFERLCAGRRFMAEDDVGDGEFVMACAAEVFRQMRIVIAGDPDPMPACLQLP